MSLTILRSRSRIKNDLAGLYPVNFPSPGSNTDLYLSRTCFSDSFCNQKISCQLSFNNSQSQFLPNRLGPSPSTTNKGVLHIAKGVKKRYKIPDVHHSHTQIYLYELYT